MKKAVLSVINDLVTDQRLDRICTTLTGMGFEVMLVGRRKKGSLPLQPRDYRMHRMKLLFSKGALFYAEYNIRLFLYLLFHRADILVSNDLDTLPANYLASRIKRKPLIHDSHEYFTETPELVNRKRVQSIWKWFERQIFPKLKTVYTVNESIAGLYEQEYGIRPHVIRNIPASGKVQPKLSRAELGLPDDKNIILLQGAGINIQRGAEEMVEAMTYMEDSIFLIVGDGDVLPVLKSMVRDLSLEEKVKFIPRQPLEKVRQYTILADIGISLDKDTNINYRFSLPNKLFDYIHAGLPILASPLVEVKKIIKKYDIGMTIQNHDPRHIADCLLNMLSDRQRMAIWKENLTFAAKELCWEKEENKLKQIYSPFV
ncbi:MAG: glycosyltransferase [Bacteroidetes bacterium]|nr:glycosyltransferase [Bacteroidota bacterium]